MFYLSKEDISLRRLEPAMLFIEYLINKDKPSNSIRQYCEVTGDNTFTFQTETDEHCLEILAEFFKRFPKNFVAKIDDC